MQLSDFLTKAKYVGAMCVFTKGPSRGHSNVILVCCFSSCRCAFLVMHPKHNLNARQSEDFSSIFCLGLPLPGNLPGYRNQSQAHQAIHEYIYDTSHYRPSAKLSCMADDFSPRGTMTKKSCPSPVRSVGCQEPSVIQPVVRGG